MQILDVWTEGEECVVIAEYISGGTLSDCLRREGVISESLAVRISGKCSRKQADVPLSGGYRAFGEDTVADDNRSGAVSAFAVHECFVDGSLSGASADLLFFLL